MKAFLHHLAFEFRTGIRNRGLLLMNYLFPLGFFLMVAFIMPGINPYMLDSMAPGMVVFAILAATLLGIPDPLVNARETGIFRSYKINGVPSLSILIIPMLTTMLHVAIVSAVITAVSGLLFKAPMPVNWLNYAIVFLVMAFASAALSVLIGVVAPNSRMTVLFSQVFFIPSMILGGLMVPLSILPDAAGKASFLLPASHGMNAFSGLAMGQAAVSPWGSVAVLAAGGLLAFGLALLLFSWDSRNTSRKVSPWLGLLCLLPYVLSVFLLK
jgi:ABC-2 type transport system permease protein